jgi:hypothetical protein
VSAAGKAACQHLGDKVRLEDVDDEVEEDQAGHKDLRATVVK